MNTGSIGRKALGLRVFLYALAVPLALAVGALAYEHPFWISPEVSGGIVFGGVILFFPVFLSVLDKIYGS